MVGSKDAVSDSGRKAATGYSLRDPEMRQLPLRFSDGQPSETPSTEKGASSSPALAAPRLVRGASPITPAPEPSAPVPVKKTTASSNTVATPSAATASNSAASLTAVGASKTATPSKPAASSKTATPKATASSKTSATPKAAAPSKTTATPKAESSSKVAASAAASSSSKVAAAPKATVPPKAKAAAPPTASVPPTAADPFKVPALPKAAAPLTAAAPPKAAASSSSSKTAAASSSSAEVLVRPKPKPVVVGLLGDKTRLQPDRDIDFFTRRKVIRTGQIEPELDPLGTASDTEEEPIISSGPLIIPNRPTSPASAASKGKATSSREPDPEESGEELGFLDLDVEDDAGSYHPVEEDEEEDVEERDDEKTSGYDSETEVIDLTVSPTRRTSAAASSSSISHSVAAKKRV
ncbi:hypothetical protein V8E36_000093 [Tilletia maclaganii]